MRSIARLLVLSIALGCVAALPGGISAEPPQNQQPDERRSRDPNDPMERMRREHLKQLNTERQEALKRDTDRLLELAKELKDYVDKSNEHTLSLDVIKKAEQIEKLARSVKEKMKGY